MRVVYRPLFRMRLRHLFYPVGCGEGTFRLRPTPSTRMELKQRNLVVKQLPDGIGVFARIEAGSDPAVLFVPLEIGDSLRMVFALDPLDPAIEQTTGLPPHRPSETVFYFSNLRKDIDEQQLFLGDSAAGQRIGKALQLVKAPELPYAVPIDTSPVFLLTDIFGKPLQPVSFQRTGESGATVQLKLDLGSVARIRPGRYQLSDGLGGSLDLFYDPDLLGSTPLGVIEIFSNTASFTVDQTDRVPAEYRFLQNQVMAAKDYVLLLPALATIWRYTVIENSRDSTVDLDQISIQVPEGFPGFDKVAEEGRVRFTSAQPIELQERYRNVELRHAGNRVCNLPNPNGRTPLRKGAVGALISEFFVYV